MALPTFDPRDRSPTLVRLLKTRLAPSREQKLLEVAVTEVRPVKPGNDECCGSSCKPCVMDMYAEELKVWKECWIKWEGGEGDRTDTQDVSLMENASIRDEMVRMPGAFEW